MVLKAHNLFPPLKPPLSPYPLPIWQGLWSMSGEHFGPTHLADSQAVLELAYHTGIVHFDTAGFYAHGQSEILLGKTLGKYRQHIFIATKGGLQWHGSHVVKDGSPNTLRKNLYESLKRLNTDYIDLFQLHWPDPKTPLEDSLSALIQFQEEGLIHQWGISNVSAQSIKQHIAKDAKIPHQIHHNLLHQETTVLHEGHHNNKCINCTYSPLEQGLLAYSGSQSKYQTLGKRDHRQKNPYFKDNKIETWLREFDHISKESDIPKSILAYMWLLADPKIDVIISGSRTLQQFHDIQALPQWVTELGLQGLDRNEWAEQLKLLFTPTQYETLFPSEHENVPSNPC